MSAAGHATFNNQITSGSHIIIPATSRLYLDGSGDTFISEVAANAIAFTTGNSERVRINSSGNMGVATNSPVSKLTVAGQVTATGGAVSAPTYSFDNDTNTGMTRPTTDTLTLVTAGAEKIRITDGGKVATGGETAADAGDGGITIDLNAGDGNFTTFKNSDVAHGMTDFAETDTLFAVRKLVNASGGAVVRGITEDEQAIQIQGMANTANTTKSTSGEGIVAVTAYIKNGTSIADPGTNANLFVVNQGGNAKFIVDTEGQLHSDGGAQSAYDTFEYAQLVRAFDLSHGNGVINSKFDKFISYNHEKLAEMKLVGREEDGTPNHFINVTGMQRLHNGAIWQQYEKTEKLANAMYELAKAAVGEEKANEILEQNEIKLLN